MAPRSSPALVLVIAGMFLLLALGAVDAQLAMNFYKKKCPKAESTVNNIVQQRVNGDRTLAASLLRLHFHDCFVDGCEASVLIDSTPGNQAEKDAPPNANSLRGFDVIDQAKAAVENICPGVVSCADILALAARDAISTIGGPSWNVPTGRRDGGRSHAATASAFLPSPTLSFSGLKANFRRVGLNAKDVVVLSAAHTIGRSHCRNIANRLYNFPGTKDGIDPTLNKAFAAQLKKKCPPGSGNTVAMDPSLGGQTFDTNYYNNLLSNTGVFKSDEALLSDGFARGIIQGELNSQAKFFADFGASMEKMGRIGILTPQTPFTGNIRQNCRRFTPASSNKTVKKTPKKSTKKTSKKTVKKTAPKKTAKKTVKKSSKKSSKKN